MRCYYHHEEDAIGFCKSCGRGLCPACAAEFDRVLACRGRCEEAVLALITILNRSLQQQAQADALLRLTRRVSLGGAVFTMLIGAVFLWYGAFGPYKLDFLYLGGAVILAYGVYLYVRWLRAPKPGPMGPSTVPERTQPAATPGGQS